MQSGCEAVSPQFISAYAWKEPSLRPALFKRAQSLLAAAEDRSAHALAPAEHPSIPWKAYLASREFQHIASDLADALFKTPASDAIVSAARPACFKLSTELPQASDAAPRRGPLAPVLAASADGSREPQESGQPSELALAA